MVLLRKKKNNQPDLMDCFSIPVCKLGDDIRGCFRTNLYSGWEQASDLVSPQPPSSDWRRERTIYLIRWQSDDDPGESLQDRWVLDVTNYIPVMQFQGAKRNHLRGSEQEGATWFWQRFLQVSDSQRCKATSSGDER